MKIATWNATDGKLLLDTPDLKIFAGTGGRELCMADGKVYYHGDDMKTYAISLDTGNVVWETQPESTNYWNAFTTYGGTSSGYGNIYFGTYDGYIYCKDIDDGKLVWKHYFGNTTQTGMGSFVPFGGRIIADGKVYGVTGEHSAPNPMPRGNYAYALNALTGEEIWRFPGLCQAEASAGQGISNGMFWFNDQYTGCTFMFGKGQTATTVSTSPGVIAEGGSVLIQGTILDQTPSSKDTPCISDASMTPWMEYLHLNWPMPTNATGVPIILQAMRSDGSIVDIATVTSDIMGHYEYAWTPPAKDTYKVLATFAGSESYFSSSTQAALAVGPAPAATEQPAAQPDNTPLLYGILGGVVAAIIIGLVAVFLSMRKR